MMADFAETAAVFLRRIEPEHNVFRFYSLRFETNLFGETELVREWGRIGHSSQVLRIATATLSDPLAFAGRLLHAKLRRGYALA
jgi:predicted DNA-binding WGR domain protein